jgi:hypothetical protein
MAKRRTLVRTGRSKRGKRTTGPARKRAKRTTAKRAKSKARHVDTKSAGHAYPSEKIEMPRIEPPPRVEFDMDGSARWLKRMNRQKADLLCTIEWSWSPVHERMESYYLQRGRTHWILSLKRFDDNWGKWEKPIAIARCLWNGLAYDKDAAMILLVAVLTEEIRYYSSDPGRFDINNTGLLSMEELDAVADAVWGRNSLNSQSAPSGSHPVT